MAPTQWADPTHPLDAVLSILHSPLNDVLEQLSTVLAELVPHRAVAMLTGDCFLSPVLGHGETALAEAVTSMELTRLAGVVDIGRPWFGPAVLAGTRRPVLAAAARPANSAGGLLAVMPEDATVPTERVLRLLQQLWELTTVHIVDLLNEAEPVYLTEQRATAGERARLIADLSDTHAVALASILGPLRSRGLDDATARQSATELAMSALLELRMSTDGERVDSEERVTEAFTHLADKLSLLTRHSDVVMELIAPDWEATLPADIAGAARATVRGAVLVMLEQGGVTRIRVTWHGADGELRIAVRDDGPGMLNTDALAVHRLTDRVSSLNGALVVDAVPSWGTTITATLPLATPEMPDAHPLARLNPREVDVIEELIRGHRNRQIAQRLQISEHTVKFHVANILGKLGVSSRGEAAAIARDAGLPHGGAKRHIRALSRSSHTNAEVRVS